MTDVAYISTVAYTTPDGSAHELTMRFTGSPTDSYWNYSSARDFYAARIEREQGKVTGYGCGPDRDSDEYKIWLAAAMSEVRGQVNL